MSESNIATSSSTHSRPPSPVARLVQGVLITTILALLLGLIGARTSEDVHTQMLKWGEHFWPNYYVLRGNEPVATCEVAPDIGARIEELRIEHEAENEDFDLFSTEFDEQDARRSLISQLEVCKKKHADHALYVKDFTPAVETFRNAEHLFADISLFAIAHEKSFLMLLLVLASIITTAKNNHIAFRSVRTRLDHQASQVAQMLSYMGLGYSTFSFYRGSYASGTDVSNPELMIILMLGCVTLSAINAYHAIKVPEQLERSGLSPRSLLTIPIQTYMLLSAVFYFFVNEGHFAGVAIYFTQIFQLTNLHLAIGLYILGGMLLKETHLGARLFDIFKPWRLPPEMLAFVAIALMAFPTAYTGASGIIIIAMGAVVYQEMRRVGTRRQLSLAVTAMTGSGVVLRPCLLVVGIAFLNKEVVTDELFYWGFRVFLLSMVVFAVFAWITRKDPVAMTPAKEALMPSLRSLGPMMPYLLILFFTLLFYAVVLETYLDEFRAPIILPVLVALVLLYERKFSKNFRERNIELQSSPTMRSAFGNAVDNSAIQIGALLMLMACSFTVGGIIERSGGEGFSIPDGFTSQAAAMGILVLFLVFIGMIMDPFGALILVTGTIAPVAYAHGIHPVHFWMTCLMAFELGYLSPPVSLNHLLTRQVVGDKEVELALKEGDTFYYRHERMLLPLMVMATTLLLVAFVPLMIDIPF